MTNAVSRMYWNERVQLAQPLVLTLHYAITAAKTVTDLYRMPALTSFDAVASQAVIDAQLGTTNEFLLVQFDATAMGTAAFAGIINLGGQAAEVYGMKATVNSGTAGVTETAAFVEDVATLTSSSLTTEVAKGANGNVAFRLIGPAGTDALTAGLIEVKIYWRSK